MKEEISYIQGIKKLRQMPMRYLGSGSYQFITLITNHDINNNIINQYCSLGLVVHNLYGKDTKQKLMAMGVL